MGANAVMWFSRDPWFAGLGCGLCEYPVCLPRLSGDVPFDVGSTGVVV